MAVVKQRVDNVVDMANATIQTAGLNALNKIDFISGILDKPFDLTFGKLLDKFDPEGAEKREQFFDEQRQGIRNQIIENKRAINEYTSGKEVTESVFLDLTSGMLEMAADPTAVITNKALGPLGFLVNACQNNLEYAVEKQTLYGKQIDLTDKNDLLNLGTGALFAKLGDMAETKAGVFEKPLAEGMDKLTKTDVLERLTPSREKFTPPLDEMMNGAKNTQRPKGFGYLDMKNLGESANRELFDQTQSIPKGEYGGDVVEEKIKTGIIPMLDKLNKEVSEQIYDKDITIKNDVSPRAVYEAFQGTGKEIELRKQQALGELNEKFFEVLPTDKKYNGVDPFSEVQYRLTHEIDPSSYVAMAQGKGNTPQEYKALGDFLHESVNKFVSIKSGEDVAQAEGYYIKTLYRQDKLQSDLVKAFNEKISSDDLIEGQLKNIGENKYVNKQQAKMLGLEKEGYYNLKDTPELLKLLNYDLEDTTHKAVEFKMKGGKFTKDQGPQNLMDVAMEWANLTPEQRKRYSELIEKYESGKKDIEVKKHEVKGKQLKKIELTDRDKDILKLSEKIDKILSPEEMEELQAIKKEAYEKFASIFEGYERRPEEINSLVFSELINEQSGLNKFVEYFSPWVDNNSKEKYGDIMGKSERVLQRNLKGKMNEAVTKKVNEIISSNSADVDVRPKLWNDPDSMDGFSKRANEVFKNYLSFRFLWGFNGIGETFSNAKLIRAGRRNLGFKENYSYLKAGYRHLRIYKNLVLHKNEILKNGLSVIADPMERREMELFLSKTLENRFIFNTEGKLKNTKKGLLKGQQRAGEQGGFWQLTSDVQRKAGAEYVASKELYKQIPYKDFGELDPETMNIFKSNGINEVKYKDIQATIKGFGTYDSFLEFLYSGKRTTGLKNDVRTLFDNFADHLGKEFDPLDKGNVGKEGFLSKMIMLYKRYSMGAFNRTCNALGTFYDSEGVLRYRYLKGGEFTLKNSLTNASVSKALDIGTNFVIGSVLTEMTMSGIKWGHGKLFGTTADEIEEAKWKALTQGDVMPLLTDSLINSVFTTTGIDVLFGMGTAVGGLFRGGKYVLKRLISAEGLPSSAKVGYGFSWLVSNNKIASGIDNIKFQRNIPNRLTTSSRTANYYWKTEYREKAEREQRIGDLPIEKAVKNIFYGIKDYTEYLDKNPEKAYEILPEGMKELPQDVAIVTASGIAEMTDDIMAKNYIMECMTEENPEKREEYLRNMDLDYKTQMDKLDLETLKKFNYIMAYQNIDDPLYILTALYDLNNTKDKDTFLDSLLDDYEKDDFIYFSKKLEENKKNMGNVFGKSREDNINGYIELVNEIGKTVRNL